MPRPAPWILIVIAFLLLLGAWATLITIAKRNAPVPIDPPARHLEP